MTPKGVAVALWILGSVVGVAWLVEAFAVGRGFISTYLAPLAFGPLILSAMLIVWSSRKEPKAARDSEER